MLLRPCNSGTGHAGKRYETTKREKEERQTERERNRKTERESAQRWNSEKREWKRGVRLLQNIRG